MSSFLSEIRTTYSILYIYISPYSAKKRQCA